MYENHTTRIRLFAATVALAAVGLGVGSTASAKFRIPEEPEVTIGERVVGKKPAASQSAARWELVYLGNGNRYGLDLYTARRRGHLGIPFG